MCDLCSQDKNIKSAAVDHHHHVADLLRRAANTYDQLAYGRLKPHTDDLKRESEICKSIIRVLVEDFV